ncbi:MAG: hypothetical protein HC892_09990 [Saprospiraceae bacterium]|nr:hypothetical protein [Saprospiraceae bacterium]
MELQVNQSPKFILIIATIVVGFLLFTITLANYEMLLRVDPIKFIGEVNPYSLDKMPENDIKFDGIKRLYVDYSFGEKLKAFLKALGYSLATLLIIVYYKSKVIKFIFVCIDSLLIFNYLHSGFFNWYEKGSYVYAAYTGIILFFVGLMASRLINDYAEREKEKQLLILKKSEPNPIPFMQQQFDIMKNDVTVLRSKISTANKFIEQQTAITEIDRKINARKQKMRRDNIDWKNDNEIKELLNLKTSILENTL